MRKEVIVIVSVVLLLFLAILSVTGLLGVYFGKKAEMVGLVAIAIVLALLLLHDRRNKGDADDNDQDTI